ncbi:MAG TPA: RnfABCDGE type electron transport complex subunit D, partial [bacterium]|nr:RnfABCDGE type electron transport complex subunit D [bacterium]
MSEKPAVTQGNKKPLISWQLPMKRVLWALAPTALAGVYFFGLRVLLLYIVVHIAGFLSEYAFAKKYNQQVSSSVFVTNMLFAMIIPPALPFWMAAVGIIFGVVFGKMVFGGFGKNIFNPALVGRAFIYVTFAVYMTGMWSEPYGGMMGGLLSYSPDAVTSATVLSSAKGTMNSIWLNAFLGNIAGSAGETSALLIILGGMYLVIKKVASREIIITTVIGLVIPQTIFWYFGVKDIPALPQGSSGIVYRMGQLTLDKDDGTYTTYIEKRERLYQKIPEYQSRRSDAGRQDTQRHFGVRDGDKDENGNAIALIDLNSVPVGEIWDLDRNKNEDCT